MTERILSAGAILDKMPELTKCRKKFMEHIFVVFLSISGRINFLQMGRYGDFTESAYRINFEQFFDFTLFNTLLIKEVGSGHFVNAFDPSYLLKNGKHTPGVGKFWSGCAGAMKKGMEIGGFSVIDIDNHTAFHLDAIQSPTAEILKQREISFLDYYAAIVCQKAPELLKLSSYLAVDAYFSKKSFIDSVSDCGLKIISRFRDDASLYYLHKGVSSGKRGRPRQYDGKVDPHNIDKAYFVCCHEDKSCRIYSAVCYSKSAKRNLKIAYTEYLDDDGNVDCYKIYFSTDLDLPAWYIVWYYQMRFQQEFLYRDAKQHTGLNQCQARGEHKLDFHFNTALTTINIAKIKYWMPIEKNQRPSFSVSDIKKIEHNALFMTKCCEALGVDYNIAQLNPKFKELTTFGTIAA